ncbi:hypothetical protein ES703_113559 [subsurface metagenome]
MSWVWVESICWRYRNIYHKPVEKRFIPRGLIDVRSLVLIEGDDHHAAIGNQREARRYDKCRVRSPGLWEMICHDRCTSGVLDSDVDGAIVVPLGPYRIVVIRGHGVSAGSQTLDPHDEHVTLFEAVVQQIMKRHCLRHLSPESCIRVGKHNGEITEGRGEGPGELDITHSGSRVPVKPTRLHIPTGIRQIDSKWFSRCPTRGCKQRYHQDEQKSSTHDSSPS